MSKRENFTAERVASFKCEAGKQQTIHWDGKIPGLGLRVTSSGAKAYVFESRLHGKTVRLTIGSPDVWPLETQWRTDNNTGERIEFQRGARQEAARLKTLTDQGIDPRDEKTEKRTKAEAAAAEAKQKAILALDIWNDYIKAREAHWGELHANTHKQVVKPGGEKRTRGLRPGEPELTQPGALRSLLNQPLSTIDSQAVKSWLKTEAQTRSTHARLCYGMLRAFMNWCSDHPEHKRHVHADACSARVAKDSLPKKAAKSDCLQREQLEVWFAEVRRLNPVQSAYLQTVLITGPRKNELTTLQWDDVDFKWGSMTIRDKVEGERTIPLTPYVASLLQGLKAMNETPPPKHRILNGKTIENDLANWKPSKWVFFSNTSKSGHIEEPRTAHDRAIKAAGLPHLSIHGLRRSFGTLAEWVECPAGISAQIMGHKPSATAEKHYRVRPLDLLRLWHTKIEGWILEQAGIEQPKQKAKPTLKEVTAA